MIERLVGIPCAKTLTSLVLDVNGVGYGVEMTPAGLGAAAVGESMTMWVHTHVTEGAFRLFGFPTIAERQMFTTLLSVSGLGPKIAMSILSQLGPATLVGIVERDDAAALEEIPGIGPRQSKKFILELKPKLEKLATLGLMPAAPPEPGLRFGASATPALPLKDLQSALENFGYKDKEVQALLKRFEREPPAKDLATLLRLALKELSGAARNDKAEDLF